MSISQKLILFSPLILFLNWRSRRIAKKIQKPEGEERYPNQWKNDYVLKRAKLFLKIYKIKLDVKGFENIPKAPAIIIPNYNSIIDPIIMFASLENHKNSLEDTNYMPIFLTKKKCLKKKRFKGYTTILETHFIDNNDSKEISKIIESMNKIAKTNKKYQIIFSEKQSSVNKEIIQLQNLAFKNAKKSFWPIIPVTINNSLNIENTSRKYIKKVEIIFHPQIKPMNIISHEIKDISNRVKKIIESKLKNIENEKAKKEINE